MGACCTKPESTEDFINNSLKPKTDKDGYVINTLPQKKIHDFGLSGLYEIIKVLGKGGTGETWLARDVKTEELVAVKIIKRPIPKLVVPMIMHEIQIQGDLGEGHLNIINAREVVLSHTHLALIMEYAAGGNLTGYVSDRWEGTEERNGLFLSEEEARFFFKQFIAAVEYCHSNKVAHRDLKLDNTLLDDHEPPRIKLCDFGFAKGWSDEAHMFTQIGTPVYMSPQLINGKGKESYDGRKADVWAGGVLLFVMMLGMFPFDHADHPDPNSSAAHAEVWLQQCKSSWRESELVADKADKLSDECRDFLDQIFLLDEHKRIDIEGIKAHPWFNLPLSGKLQAALDKIQQEQLAIDRLVAQGLTKSKDRDRALADMMEASSHEPNPGDPVLRVSLTKVQSRYHLLSNSHTEVGEKVGEAPRLSHDIPTIMEDSSKHGSVELSELLVAQAGTGMVTAGHGGGARV